MWGSFVGEVSISVLSADDAKHGIHNCSSCGRLFRDAPVEKMFFSPSQPCKQLTDTNSNCEKNLIYKTTSPASKNNLLEVSPMSTELSSNFCQNPECVFGCMCMSDENSKSENSLEQNSPSSKSNLLLTLPMSIELSPELCQNPECACKNRIQMLKKKFAETLRLLALKQIDLNAEPPSFIPPSPPPKKPPRKTEEKFVINNSHSFSGSHFSLQEISNRDSSDETGQPLDKSSNWKTASDSRLADVSSTSSSSNLCKKCSNSISSHLSETIEDLPKLLPTDALNRPHLGLSYSLEDDLSPGIKEIRNASTPKSDGSSTSLFRTKENLSTFSQSNSSLGYVSSQSDLELNQIPTLPDKIPISSFRSRTLPNGATERSPFYSPAEDYPSFYSDQNGYQEYSHKNFLTVEQAFESRSSSAPPPPAPEKTKKKHLRGFSRKEKKRNKSDDTSSLESSMSIDDRIIFKTTDGSAIYIDSTATETKRGVEPKRRSVWKSIIRKKS